MYFSHRQLRLIPIACATLFLFLGSVSAQQSLTIGSDSTLGLNSQTLPVLLTSTDTSEGFVLAIAFDATIVAVDDVSIVGTVTEAVGAELVVPEILPNGVTLGVVLDIGPPFDAQMIPVGADQLLANLEVRPTLLVNMATDTLFEFVNSTLNSPPLDNIIVQAGQSIGENQGLQLNDGTLTLLPPPPDSLTIESLSVLSDRSGDARVLMTNMSGPVQGFVLAISHDESVLTLEEINLEGTVTDSIGAELVVPQVVSGGGTIGIVLDFQSPFDGQTIPLGNDQHIANYKYSCNDTIIEPAMALSTALTFLDGTLNSPPLDNVIVVNGMSINPALNDGTYTCLPIPRPPTENTEFFCGPIDLPETGESRIFATAGEAVEICFFYQDEDDNLQGLQIAACVDCNITMLDFSIEGSIINDIGAEFLDFNFDNDPNDGDGCEFVAGLLLDALPPFDNQTAPSSAVPLLVGCLSAVLSEDAPCDTDLPIMFCDGANGSGSVAIDNIAVIDFESIQSFEKTGCFVHVTPEEAFQRGDCNSDDKVNLADAATILGQQFLGTEVLCPDACDSNDDGKINLADSVHILNYLFRFGEPPLDPGPNNDGPDPTDDFLGECMSDDSAC